MRSTAVPSAQHSPPDRGQEAAEQGEPHTHLSPRKKKVCPVGSHQTAVSMLS